MTRRATTFVSRPMACLLGMVALGLGGVTTATAQWEHIYGGANIETGYNGVAPVVNLNCPMGSGGGYIAVGRSNTPTGGGTYDSYVVRTAPGGGVIWANTIDVSGIGANDEAYSVVEIPAGGGVNGGGGFLVVGTTDEAAGTGSRDVYAMELDCNGNVVWTTTYGAAGTWDEARDVTLTFNGNNMPPQFCVPGDYVIAGSTFSGPSGTQDALLVRIGFNGVLKWNMAYDGGATEFLRAVLESNNVPGAAGDIVAAGGAFTTAALMQGLAMRVNGNNGVIGLAPQGYAEWGGLNSNEVFNNVEELALMPSAGQLVFVGLTTLNPPSDIYVVKTAPSPCAQMVQTIINGVNTTDQDIAYDVQEDAFGHLGPVGTLALTGSTNTGLPALEMFLLPISQNNLGVLAVGGFTYGDQAPPGTGVNNEEGFSLELDAGGYILCGYTNTNMNFNNPADPEQLYLVRPNGAGVSGPGPGCQFAWNPTNQTPTWNQLCPVPVLSSPLVNIRWTRTSAALVGDVPVCPRRPCIIKLPGREGGNDGGHTGVSGVDLTDDATGATILRSYPNPVRRGSYMTLEFMPISKNTITVKVTNVLGEVMGGLNAENEGGLSRFALQTDELAAGTYVIEVSDGVRTRMLQVVVTD